MAESAEYWYLEPDVDPSTIRVPQLRSILLKHGVTYPSSAKKPELLALFNDNVLPQAAKLHRAHARTKPSTRGIEDVPSSASTTDDHEDETVLAPPPSTRRTARRTTRSVTDEPMESRTPARTSRARLTTDELLESRTPARSARTPSRTVPTKHARGSDGEPEEQPPTVRRNRMSATPAIKREPSEPEAWHREAADSPFTQENPFQSGSSPAGLDGVRDRRRRTLGSEQKERRKSEQRRKTFQPKVEQLDEGIVVPTRQTFDMPVSRTRKEEPVEYVDEVDAGEEFTPEEQLELVRARAQAGEVDILPPRRRRRQPPKATSTLKAFTLTLLGTAATLLGGAWRQEKLAVGFCGVGREATSLGGVDLPEFASDLLPQCEPCPPHATCYQDLVIVCDKDFVKKQHPLSLNGLIPLPATCEPDSEKTRRIGVVADRTVQVLRERNAKFECGETDTDGQVVKSPQVSESDLKKELSSMKRRDMSQSEFDDLFESALGEVVRRDEIVASSASNKAITSETTPSDKNANANANTNTNTNSHRRDTRAKSRSHGSKGEPGERLLASSSLANLPLTCSIRRSVRHTLERYFWQAALILLTLLSLSYGKYSLTSSRQMEVRAKQLAADVFDRLANHAALNHQEPGAYPDQGVSMTQLRDDVLRNEFSAKRRKALWERVQRKVEGNSNVRAAVRENHSGDVARMWEWVGPVRLLEDGGRSSGKGESGRFITSPAAAAGSPDVKGRAVVKKWDEGHPIY